MIRYILFIFFVALALAALTMWWVPIVNWLTRKHNKSFERFDKKMSKKK